jgi:hypothetical protein
MSCVCLVLGNTIKCAHIADYTSLLRMYIYYTHAGHFACEGTAFLRLLNATLESHKGVLRVSIFTLPDGSSIRITHQEDGFVVFACEKFIYLQASL